MRLENNGFNIINKLHVIRFRKLFNESVYPDIDRSTIGQLSGQLSGTLHLL